MSEVGFALYKSMRAGILDRRADLGLDEIEMISVLVNLAASEIARRTARAERDRLENAVVVALKDAIARHALQRLAVDPALALESLRNSKKTA